MAIYMRTPVLRSASEIHTGYLILHEIYMSCWAIRNDATQDDDI